MIMRIWVTAMLILLYAPQADAQTYDLCDTIKHKVSEADYQPGVDVHGNDVAPANLDHTAPILNMPIILPIDLDVVQRYGITLPVGLEVKPTLIDLEIYADGHIKYNGSDITDSIKDRCHENEKNEENQSEQDGHESSNPLGSSLDFHDNQRDNFSE